MVQENTERSTTDLSLIGKCHQIGKFFLYEPNIVIIHFTSGSDSKLCLLNINKSNIFCTRSHLGPTRRNMGKVRKYEVFPYQKLSSGLSRLQT